jgi:hypothetical protein
MPEESVGNFLRLCRVIRITSNQVHFVHCFYKYCNINRKQLSQSHDFDAIFVPSSGPKKEKLCGSGSYPLSHIMKKQLMHTVICIGLQLHNILITQE